jgi:predicted  nucleic acid-binding Zn-ribbon protein
VEQEERGSPGGRRLARCPGTDSRSVRPEYRRCTECGYRLEFFSDELTRRCPQCGSKQMKEAQPSCVAWCPAAEACVGDPEKVRQIREAVLLDVKPEEVERFKKLSQQIRESEAR